MIIARRLLFLLYKSTVIKFNDSDKSKWVSEYTQLFISFDKSLLKIHEQEFIGKLYVARKLLKKFLITRRMPIVSTRFKLSEAFIRKTRSHTITLISYLSEDRSHTDKYKLYRRLWTLSVLSVCEKPKYVYLTIFFDSKHWSM